MNRNHVNLIDRNKTIIPFIKDEIRKIREFLYDNAVYNFNVIENCLEFKIGGIPFIIVKEYDHENECIKYREQTAFYKDKTYQSLEPEEFLRQLRVKIWKTPR